jgi:hypothetical protein
MDQKKSVLQRVAAKFDKEHFKTLNEEITFSEYLNKVYANPLLIRTSFQRIYDMIMSKGSYEFQRYRKTLKHYHFFDDEEIPLFGLETTLDEFVKFVRGAAGGYGTERRILLLHGPVGSAKSTIARRLKRGLEQYSHTDEGAWYSYKWVNLPTGQDGIYTQTEDKCPMHDDPLKLIPMNIRKKILAELNEIHKDNQPEEKRNSAYTLKCEGELNPRCKFFMGEMLKRYDGDWEKVVTNHIKVVRQVHSEADRVGIATFQPKDEKNQDATELTGDINYAKLPHFGSDSDSRSFEFNGEFCFPAGTPVRMADGSERNIEDLRIGDRVVTHTGKSRYVINTMNRVYSGEMIKLKVRSFPFPITMTSDHPVAVIAGRCNWRWQPGALIWKKAGELTTEDRVIIGYSRDPLPRSNLDTSTLFGNDKFKIIDDKVRMLCSMKKSAIYRYVPISPSLGRFIGLYLAEGGCTHKKVKFDLSAKEESLAMEIIALGKGLFGAKGTTRLVNKNKTGRVVEFNNVNLVRVIKHLVPDKVYTKRVPAQFFNADEQIKLAIIMGWLDGDGHQKVRRDKDAKARMRITGVTTSIGLARDMTVLAYSCGMSSAVCVRKEMAQSKVSYGVDVGGRKALAMYPTFASKVKDHGIKLWASDSNRTQFGYARRVRSLERIPVKDVEVYDFTVEEDHSFLAGDIIVHNCVANRGLFELIEMLKLDQAFLYDLLGASQEKQIKPKKFSQIAIDEMLLGHSVHGDTPIPHEYDGVLDVLPISQMASLDHTKLRVFSVNVETREIELCGVKKVFSHNFNGEWVENHQDGDVLITTPNHSVYNKDYETFYPGEDTETEILTLEIPDYLVNDKPKTQRWENYFLEADDSYTDEQQVALV